MRLNETSIASVANTTTAYGTQNITQIRRDYTTQADWFIPIVQCIIFILLILWVLLSLIYYGIKTGKWIAHHHRSSDKLNVGEIYTFVVITALICICFLCVNVAYINVGFNPGEDELCDTVSDVALAVYFLKLCSVCIFLWLRQRVFYKNFVLSTGYSKIIRIFSSSSIIFILLFGAAALVFNVLPDDHKSSPNGCIYVPSDEYKVWYWVAAVVAVVFGQFTLMSLFIYGLKKTSREKWMPWQFCCYGREKNRSQTDLPFSADEANKSNSASRTQNFTSSSFKPNSGTMSTSSSTNQIDDQSIAVQRILWKTLIFAIISILADMFLQVIIHYFVPSDSHRRTSVAISNLNAVLNVFLLLFSFVKWKEILTTFCN